MTEQQTVTVRRAPKVGAFISTFAALGFVVSTIITLFFPANGEVGIGETIGYMSVYGIGIGATVGALIFLLIDSRGTVGSGVAEFSASPGGSDAGISAGDAGAGVGDGGAGSSAS